MYIQRGKRVYANDDINDEVIDDVVEDGDEDVIVEPEATELLFETEDVAELVAETTGEPVEVSVEEDSVTFAVGDDEYTVEPEGDEEILESTRKPMARKRRVSASTRRRRGAKRRVSASTKSGRTIRKVPSRRK